MHPRSFVSVAALCAGALALPQAVEAQVAVDQQAQATPAPAAPAPAAPAAPTSNAMSTPAMGGTITANPNPYSVDLGPWLGKTYIAGVLTGMGFVQSSHVPVEFGISPPTLPNGFSGNNTAKADITNGMVEVQKTDGQLQYFLHGRRLFVPDRRRALCQRAYIEQRAVRAGADRLREVGADR